MLKNQTFSHLKFRRQFLLSSTECTALNNWKSLEFGSYYLYTHPECGLEMVSKNDTQVALIGYFFDPHRPEVSEELLLESFADSNSVSEISEVLYPLVGRFLLLIRKKDYTSVYNDACGLKTFFYTYSNHHFYAASQPNLLKLVTPIKKGMRHETYMNSKYVKSNKEHYLPCGSTLYNFVEQLLPNHYLDVNQNRQKRFWPNSKLVIKKVEEVESDLTELIKKTMYAANLRFKLAFSLTAGLDSRLLLSACKEIKDDIHFYTLQYRNLTKKSPDISIPIRMASDLKLNWDLIDCRGYEDQEFLNIYSDNSDTAHLNDWGKIAAGMYRSYNSSEIAVKGNCVEIGRCFYYNNGAHPEHINGKKLMELENYWSNLDFIEKDLDIWHQEINDDLANFGYNELDLFYWEHRVGSWQAQSQLEWDIVQEVFTPFNNRELVNLMLSTDSLNRTKPDYVLFKKSITRLWPEILKYPINPLTLSSKIKIAIKKTLKKMRIHKYVKRVIS